jgi:outer membrane protein OmpA-like peptidoglycan-associated protein
MRQRNHFVAGLLLSLPAATVMAAPPRFNGIGDVLSGEPVVSATAATMPASATASATKADTPVAAKETKPIAEPTQAAPAKSDKPVDVSKKTETVPPKKSHSWLWRLFHKNSSVEKNEITRKKDGELVNTDTRHKEVYDLLQTADVHHFEPGYDGRWHVQASNVMCRMKQQLPSYGYVEFRQGVAQPLEFALYVDHPPAGSGIVQVSSNPPLWQHYVKAKDLGTLELDNSDRAVTASSAWSRRLLLELGEGMQPVLHFWDAADASEDIEVFLSAIQFQESLNLFQHCLGQLLHYDFKQVRFNVLHFNPDSSKMHKQTYQQLDEVLETTKADKGITAINLEIYTHRDGLERYNFRLATRRAQAVRDYLIKHGIKEDIVFIKIHTKNKSQMAKLGYKDSDVYIALQRDKKK